jgi:hypothetical protein
MTKTHPDDHTTGAADSAVMAETPEEDSESSPELHPAVRAKNLADTVLHTPTTNSQAIELAKVYALLAIHEAMTTPKDKS